MGREGRERGGRECQEGREVSGNAEVSFTALSEALSASAGFSSGHTMRRCNVP